MPDHPLVSIVTPCFNGEGTLGRLLDSVLAQTHPTIELILVNDGSTDGTDDVVARYRRELVAQLSAFTYVRQENRGLGGAINAGLARVNGQYLCWPDADDYLEPTSVAERVAVLESSPEYAVVTSDAYLRSSTDPSNILGRVSSSFRHNADEWQFKLLLRGDSIFTSGCHMACMRRFDETHPRRTIYPARRGQNWQMLLPLYHRYRRFFLDDPLYNYVVSEGSMSRTDDTLDKSLERAFGHQDILLNTMASMAMDTTDRRRSERLATGFVARTIMRAGTRFNDGETVLCGFRMLAQAGQVTPRDRATLTLARHRGFRRPYALAREIARRIRDGV